MLQCLPLETSYESLALVREAVQRGLPGTRRTEISTLGLPQKTRCQFRKKEPRGIRTIALLSVFSKWFTTVRVDLLQVGKEPIEGWKGVNCKHVQALLTKILQRRWSGRQTAGPIWNRDSPDTRRPSWQAWTKKTAFDVAKPTVVSKLLSLTGVHGQWRRLYWQKCRTCRDRLVLRIARHEPNLLDDFHYSETTEIFFQEQSSDAVPWYLHDAELSDETTGRALSSPLEKNQRTVDKLITLLKKVCCQVSI